MSGPGADVRRPTCNRGATVQYRTETDSMGDVNVPADAYYLSLIHISEPTRPY